MMRTMLPLVTFVIAAGLAPVDGRQHDHAPPAPSAVPAGTPPGPSVLVNTSSRPRTLEVTITAAPERLAFQPGQPTIGYAYNGRVPGPTLDMREGDRVIVHFHNRLPEPTTIHWHGLHIPNGSDGSPFAPVQPGKSRDYVFTLQPGSAGTYWYHPHPHRTTGHQIARGLYGALIVRAARRSAAVGLREQLLILADNRFTPDGAIDFSGAHVDAGRRRRGERPRGRRAVRERRDLARRSTSAAAKCSGGGSSTLRRPASTGWRSRAYAFFMSAAMADCSSDRSRSTRSCSPTASAWSCSCAAPARPAAAHVLQSLPVRSLRPADATGRLEPAARPAHAAVHRPAPASTPTVIPGSVARGCRRSTPRERPRRA